MYRNRLMRVCAPALGLALTLGFSSIAMAQAADDKKADKPVAPDNTKVNDRDRNDNAPTADKQKNNKSDVEVAAEIRRAIVGDKTLSTNAHNVKIIAQDGAVTLKGPVHSEAEKTTIEQKAVAVVGQANVTNQLEVKP